MSKVSIHRIVNRKTVSEIKRNGRKVVTDCFVLCFTDNHSECLNYAIHIRKRFGNAVMRNRAKRVFRAALSALSEIIRGLNVIIIPRRNVKGLGSSEVRVLLENCFSGTGSSPGNSPGNSQ